MSEKTKTYILLILIAIALGFIWYTRMGYEQNFIDTLR
jgi:hypothetical protein